MEQLILSFLNETNQSGEIKQAFIEYTKNVGENQSQFINANESQLISASIVLSFRYNYANLVNVSQRLLYFIINNPQKYDLMVRNVVLKYMNKELEETSKQYKVKIEQIHCIHRFEGLPLKRQYTFYPKINTLMNLTAVLAARGSAKMYIRHTVWNCETKCFPDKVADDVPIPRCEGCWKNMKEYVELRDMSEHLELNVFQLEELQTPTYMGTMSHKLVVILRDDLTKFNIYFGHAYIITGIYDVTKNAFYAWNIVEKEDI